MKAETDGRIGLQGVRSNDLPIQDALVPRPISTETTGLQLLRFFSDHLSFDVLYLFLSLDCSYISPGSFCTINSYLPTCNTTPLSGVTMNGITESKQRYLGYPKAVEGPHVPYKKSADSNPVIGGKALVAGAWLYVYLHSEQRLH